jgi:hypothetical protein
VKCYLQRYTLLLALLVLGPVTGCRSNGCCAKTPLDKEIRRCSEAGFTALAESTAEEAVAYYRCAVKRAWAMNDYREIANNTYNLSSAFFADDHCAEGRDWVLESRAAFLCGGMDATPTFLLESKIARKQKQFGESDVLLKSASCSIDHIPFCNLDKLARTTGGFNVKLLEAVPGSQLANCTNSKRKRRLRAQTQLERAELACDLCDIDRANTALEHAKDLRGHDDDIIDAGIARVSGRILEVQGRSRLAASRYCAEAGILRAHGRYREMADALEAAGSAFESGAAYSEAAEAFHQSARSHFGRNEYLDALRLIECARRCAETCCRHDMTRRVALLFREVSREVAERSDLPDTDARPTQVPDVPLTPPPAAPSETPADEAAQPEKAAARRQRGVNAEPDYFIPTSRVPPPFELVLPEPE